MLGNDDVDNDDDDVETKNPLFLTILIISIQNFLKETICELHRKCTFNDEYNLSSSSTRDDTFCLVFPAT